MYILTTKGTLYRSTDKGKTFLNQMSKIPEWNNDTLSYPTAQTGIKSIKGAGKDGIVNNQEYIHQKKESI